MSYWDTSALVKLYAREQDSMAFVSHAMNAPSKPVTSRIALYEAQATFQRKEAEGILPAGLAEELYGRLPTDVNRGERHLVELGIDVELEYGRVLNVCYGRRPPLFIRTLDAVHLASARVAGETEIVATDNRMREAAELLGFSLFPH